MAAARAGPRLVITSGDPGGIGPELVRRALADPGIRGLAEFTVTGPVDGTAADGAAAIPVGRASAAGGRAAVEAVRSAVELLATGSADALVTAPVSKEALQLAGYPWPGQTEMLAGLCGASDLRVLLMAGPLRVVHVSAHRSLRQAVEAVTVASVRRTIELADAFGRRPGHRVLRQIADARLGQRAAHQFRADPARVTRRDHQARPGRH